jgi:N-acyl-D-amino-acid deacylase
MIDTLIRNAQIVDGTGDPSHQGDVAIQGERISDIGPLGGASAERIIDARGLVLVPGFIDIHSHADLSLLFSPGAGSLVHQGITTVVTGQCGLSPAPLTRKNRTETLRTFKMVAPSAGQVPWQEMPSFGGFLEHLERTRTSVNVVPLVGQGMIRSAVMGYRAGPATPEQMQHMHALVHEAMDSGAFGISTGLIYPPGSFTSTEELVQVVRPVGERRGLYFSHVRGEAETLLDAYEEAIEIGHRTGAAVQIAHCKAAGKKNWDKASRALELIDRARDEGLDVTADMYPYLAGSTHLAALLPRWATEGGALGVLRRLVLPWERKRIVNAWKRGEGGVVGEIEWDKILISGSGKAQYVGHYVSELAAEEGKDPHTWTLDALLKTFGNLMMVVFLMSEENVRMQLSHRAMMIGTDGFGLAAEGPMATGKPHPRSFGTYPRIFGQYVRDEGTLSLEEASWKASGFPAQKLGLPDRGVIKKGAKADLVLFDPATIRDRATYREPLQYPSGIECVLINGQVVVEQGKQTPARPGEVIRRSW